MRKWSNTLDKFIFSTSKAISFTDKTGFILRENKEKLI